MPPTFVRVDPPELLFEMRGGRLEDAKLKLINVSSHRVGFKLFTDHSDLYIFQPKSGFVERSKTVEVTVKLVSVPDERAVATHVTVLKTRAAGDDELDREKEWRVMTSQDEHKLQVIRLSTRFGAPAKVTDDGGVLEALRRMEGRLNDKLTMLSNVAGLTLILVIIVLLVAIIGLGSR